MTASPDETGRAGIPQHVGIIMDGNGRWARQRDMKRTSGHREGLNAAKRVVSAASRLGIRFLSLYTFSTENWRRTEDEVSFLMGLIRQNLRKEYDFYRENRIRVVHSGDLTRLPPDVQREIAEVGEQTARFEGLTVNLAINYGGRDEILRAVNRWLSDQETGRPPLTDETIRAYFDQPDLPDPDLIIRTGGELRTSNFLLWQSAYSELYFSGKLWPDWGEDDLEAALLDFRQRERRFGGAE